MPVIHPEGHIRDKKYEWCATKDLAGTIARSELLAENKALLERFVMDARLGKTILKGAKKKVGILRQVKYLQDLKKLDKYFQKPLDKVEQPEMERFILDLEEGRLKTLTGKPYAPETQVCMKKIIIKFYKWINGGKYAPDLVAWIDTSCHIKDYKAINKEQVDVMLMQITSNTSHNLIRNRAILAFLFDSGCRADELLNIRLKHLTLENGNYKARVEFSKTKPRTISVPFCKAYLDAWLDTHPARDNPLSQLFPLSYDALEKVVNQGGKCLKWHLTPHSLRHSSVTYYARSLSRYQLCYRYGWAMSSRQPDRYIDKEGLDQEKVAEIVEADKVNRLSRENSQLNQRMALLEDQLDRLMKADKEELRHIIATVLSQSEAQKVPK